MNRKEKFDSASHSILLSEFASKKIHFLPSMIGIPLAQNLNKFFSGESLRQSHILEIWHRHWIPILHLKISCWSLNIFKRSIQDWIKHYPRDPQPLFRGFECSSNIWRNLPVSSGYFGVFFKSWQYPRIFWIHTFQQFTQRMKIKEEPSTTRVVHIFSLNAIPIWQLYFQLVSALLK